MASKFTFADLFAGIGGMRLAFERNGGACVLTSEIDHHARVTYLAQKWRSNDDRHVFIDDVVDLGNEVISRMRDKSIPDFDVMIAGFPCQPYSIAGLRQGLEDEKGRGQVFLSMLDVLKKRPRAFLLENVKGMLSHDGGRTIAYMEKCLTDCGYTVLSPTVLNSMNHGGVPQNRERVFLVGFRDDLQISREIRRRKENNVERHEAESMFQWPKEIDLKMSLQDLLDPDAPEKYEYTAEKYDCYHDLAAAITRTDTAYQWRRVYVRENKSGVCPALTANMGSGGHNVPLVKVNGKIRKLTPRECARLQGFPESFVFPSGLADMHLYHQFGNSVTVPLIERIARELVRHLLRD